MFRACVIFAGLSAFMLHNASLCEAVQPCNLFVYAKQTPSWFCKKNHGGNDKTVYRLNAFGKRMSHQHMRCLILEWARAMRMRHEQLFEQQQHVQKQEYTVRVLLAEMSLHTDPHVWQLQGTSDLDVYMVPETRSALCGKQLRITVRRGNVYINNRLCTQSLVTIKPRDGHIVFGDRMYSGTCMLVVQSSKLYLVNAVDLEEYICGVLSTESWPGWPLEVNKVLAIAARSYVMAMIMRSSSSKLPYHIRNTNYHQTYGGANANKVHRQAVEETRGVFLAYNNQPIIAMFDGCCGGVIPAHIADTAFDDAPYLARPYACHYCKSCKIYNWHAEYTVHDFLQKIKKEHPHMTAIKTVLVAKKDKAGLVKEVKCKGHGKHHACVTGKKVYSLFKEVKSFCFTVTHRNNRIALHGRGFGHHIGLCQWGARQMVNEGQDYFRILSFYYPGTVIMKRV